jgi:glycosyltransferase involved in cell wall biosynthesis
MFPGADLISNVVNPRLLTGPLENRRVIETFVHKLPFARRNHQLYLPLMPLALETVDMSPYDLIISSESGPAKWVIKEPEAHHICYCHSPLRYIWDQRTLYMKQIPRPVRPFAEAYASHLRRSDQGSAMRVDQFVANSKFVAQRIESYYRRDSVVIHPPVSVEDFSPSDSVEDYYLLAGELRAYKGAAIAIEACAKLNRRLVIMGGGDNAALRKLAGPNVEFLGRVDDATFKNTLARCRALLFPGVEDFGIIPVEVMASGRPVIARAKGGALETVVDGVTGILYDDPRAAGLERAILEFEAEERHFKAEACVRQAQRFSRATFETAFAKLLPDGALNRPNSKILDIATSGVGGKRGSPANLETIPGFSTGR